MSEMSELYTSMALKTLAISLVGIFLPVYLYQEGYLIEQIIVYFAFYFAIRTVFNVLAGKLVAMVGPKHVLSYSYVMLIIFLFLLDTLPTYGWPLLLIAGVNALFNSLFFIAYHVDFSKIHSAKNSGSELSWMSIVSRTAAAIGPFVGGLIATFFSIGVTITIALVLVLLAIWPLMLTSEPTQQQKKLNLNSFDIRKYTRNMFAYSWMGISRQVSLSLWPLYISVFVFVDDVYAKVGFVTSISIVATLFVTRMYGKLIDKNNGRALLGGSAVVSSAVHLARPHVPTIGGVGLVNMTSEFAETGVLLPFTKGFYDEADSAKNRIAYIVMMESIIELARSVFWLVILMIAIQFDPKTALITSFYIASVGALLTTTQGFAALRK